MKLEYEVIHTVVLESISWDTYLEALIIFGVFDPDTILFLAEANFSSPSLSYRNFLMWYFVAGQPDQWLIDRYSQFTIGCHDISKVLEVVSSEFEQFPLALTHIIQIWRIDISAKSIAENHFSHPLVTDILWTLYIYLAVIYHLHSIYISDLDIIITTHLY